MKSPFECPGQRKIQQNQMHLSNILKSLFSSAGTWIRVSIWLLVGVFVYLFYGRSHSSLTDAVYVPVAHADEIYRTSTEYVA